MDLLSCLLEREDAEEKLNRLNEELTESSSSSSLDTHPLLKKVLGKNSVGA